MSVNLGTLHQVGSLAPAPYTPKSNPRNHIAGTNCSTGLSSLLSGPQCDDPLSVGISARCIPKPCRIDDAVGAWAFAHGRRVALSGCQRKLDRGWIDHAPAWSKPSGCTREFLQQRVARSSNSS
eukprot:2592815-Rhodomonas_salina.2